MGQLLLVRHGQASWGAADYDVLSDLGHGQSALLGRFLADRGISPDLLVAGGMRRHRETAEEMFPGAEPVLDPGWDEFDHVAMLAKVPAPFEGRKPTKEEFQAWFEEATDRWTGGRHDGYAESFAAFSARVDQAVRRTTEQAGGGTAVVVTSGGPISWTVAALVGADLDPADRVRLWRRLNPVCVNSGVTRLVTGRRGTTMVTFNEHAHLDGTDLLTYR